MKVALINDDGSIMFAVGDTVFRQFDRNVAEWQDEAHCAGYDPAGPFTVEAVSISWAGWPMVKLAELPLRYAAGNFTKGE